MFRDLCSVSGFPANWLLSCTWLPSTGASPPIWTHSDGTTDLRWSCHFLIGSESVVLLISSLQKSFPHWLADAWDATLGTSPIVSNSVLCEHSPNLVGPGCDAEITSVRCKHFFVNEWLTSYSWLLGALKSFMNSLLWRGWMKISPRLNHRQEIHELWGREAK